MQSSRKFALGYHVPAIDFIFFSLGPWISYGITFVLYVSSTGDDWIGLGDSLQNIFFNYGIFVLPAVSWDPGLQNLSIVKSPFAGLNNHSSDLQSALHVSGSLYKLSIFKITISLFFAFYRKEDRKSGKLNDLPKASASQIPVHFPVMSISLPYYHTCPVTHKYPLVIFPYPIVSVISINSEITVKSTF